MQGPKIPGQIWSHVTGKGLCRRPRSLRGVLSRGEERPHYQMKTRVPGGNGTCSRSSRLWLSQRTDQTNVQHPGSPPSPYSFVHSFIHQMHPACVVARTGRRTGLDSELTPGQAGMGRREEKMIRLDGDCSDGGSRGQGRGVSQTEMHGVRGEEGIPGRRNSNYKGLEEGDGEKGTWNTKTKQKTISQELGGQRRVARWGCGCGRGPVARTGLPGQGACWLPGLYGEHL